MVLKESVSEIRTPIMRRLAEPQILFSIFALVLLGIIWSWTFNLIKVERANAVRMAITTSREVVETYEAQVLRALREIDQALRVVKYAYEGRGAQMALAQLKERSLLPPDIVFAVSIADEGGNVVASTRPPERSNIADQAYFLSLRTQDSMLVGLPRPGRNAAEWNLLFGRRLSKADGAFAGVVTISVDAAHFVSGYEVSQLGSQGLMGVLGTDGVFRARRTGDAVFAGDKVDYAAALVGTEEQGVALAANPWDGVRRYISVRRLYNFPLAVVVGLSETEQLAAANKNIRSYLQLATAGSVMLILVLAALGRLSWQLARVRHREAEAKIAHAKRVEYLAYHDGLTGLPNRSLFSKLLNQIIGLAQRNDRVLAVLFLDLDRFKQINDTLGHIAGDQLLQEVARRLKAVLRDSDAVSRLGGDEFVVMLPELLDGSYAATAAQKILNAIARPYTLLGQEFRVTASVGISIFPQDGKDEQTLTKNADIAMYQAKEEGKNNFQFYSEKLNANSLERLALESSLRRALDGDEFQLHYQAKMGLKDGRITGMEVLLRWQHPDLGTVAPMQFIPVAEETGLIVPIGKWILRTACRQNVAWQQKGLPPLIMGVNLTMRQFLHEQLLKDIADVLQESGMAPQLLELEVTERILMHDVDATLRVLNGLKEMGVRVAIDNFGSGYSSLAMLRQFPLDTIKIDRSFVRGLNDDEGANKELTDAIIAVGKTLSLKVIAEGVENIEQMEFLREHSCTELQGFYFNKPIPADQFTELLKNDIVREAA